MEIICHPCYRPISWFKTWCAEENCDISYYYKAVGFGRGNYIDGRYELFLSIFLDIVIASTDFRGLSIQGTTSRATLPPSPSAQPLPKNVPSSSFREVFGCDMIAFIVFENSGEVILSIILAWVFFFSKLLSASNLSSCGRITMLVTLR